MPTCLNPFPSRNLICLGVVRPSSLRLLSLSKIIEALPALSIVSGNIPHFSSALICLFDGGAISQPNEGMYVDRSSACMLISNCNGSTSLRLRLLISSSCLARASSLCATTSDAAFSSASSISIAVPAAISMFSVIFLATSSFSQMRLAGWQSSCLSVCHRKSSNSKSSFPGYNLVPLPTICE